MEKSSFSKGCYWLLGNNLETLLNIYCSHYKHEGKTVAFKTEEKSRNELTFSVWRGEEVDGRRCIVWLWAFAKNMQHFLSNREKTCLSLVLIVYVCYWEERKCFWIRQCYSKLPCNFKLWFLWEFFSLVLLSTKKKILRITK